MADGSTRHDDPDEDARRAPLGAAAYLAARAQAEDDLVRGAFADLRDRVRAEVKAPPARLLVARSRRRRARTAQRRVLFAAAAAVLVVGGAGLVVRQPAADDTPSTTAGPRPVPTSASPSSTSTGRTTGPDVVTPPPSPAAPVTSSRAVATRTVVVTVPQPSGTRTSRRPSPSRTAPPAASPSSAGPRTDVTVYLWQGRLYPACLNQYPVKRTVDGTGGWAAAVRATLAGTSASESAAGYVSPFGAGVSAAVDEGTHTVDFASTAAMSGVAPLCRTSLEQLVTRTATDAGYPATVELNGSTLLWMNWRSGLS